MYSIIGGRRSKGKTRELTALDKLAIITTNYKRMDRYHMTSLDMKTRPAVIVFVTSALATLLAFVGIAVYFFSASADSHGIGILPLLLVSMAAVDLFAALIALKLMFARIGDDAQRQHASLGKELRMAKRVQGKLIPRLEDFEARPELSFAGYYAAKGNVGGDIYDIIRIGKNVYGFLIADVAGHGVDAAFIMIMVKLSFQYKARWGVSSSQVMKEANGELLRVMGGLDHYVAACFCILDLESGLFQYTNAGHLPPLLFGKSGEIEKLGESGSFLGVSDKMHYESGERVLLPGERILFFTDGIIEARDKHKKEYGSERLESSIRGNRQKNPEDFVDTLVREVGRFTQGTAQHDDQAMLVVDFRSLTPGSNMHAGHEDHVSA